jgi:hypothetical protein
MIMHISVRVVSCSMSAFMLEPLNRLVNVDAFLAFLSANFKIAIL